MRLPDETSFLGRIFDRLTRGNYRYTEYRMSVGAPLYAIGAFRSVGGVSSVDVDAATAELLRDWKRDQAALLQRFDSDGDGVLRQSANGMWRALGRVNRSSAPPSISRSRHA